jgi:hypothetical protein
MTNTPHTGFDPARTQAAVDALKLGATARNFTNRNVTEIIELQRPGGQRGFRAQPVDYDFGNDYSVPAVVVAGRVNRLDGKPYRAS